MLNRLLLLAAYVALISAWPFGKSAPVEWPDVSPDLVLMADVPHSVQLCWNRYVHILNS
jgi:hypothetical protein